MSNLPRFEKVNEHTIRIINEKADEVKINNLIDTLKQLEEKKTQINKAIDNVNTVLQAAIELNIVPEEKDNNPIK